MKTHRILPYVADKSFSLSNIVLQATRYCHFRLPLSSYIVASESSASIFFKKKNIILESNGRF